MTDETHKKLLRGLEAAESKAGTNAAHNVLERVVTPLAIASIALELRELRILMDKQ